MKEKIYSIILTNGKIINIKATEIEWRKEERMLLFFNNHDTVAEINMDTIVGWMDPVVGYIAQDYKEESEE